MWFVFVFSPLISLTQKKHDCRMTTMNATPRFQQPTPSYWRIIRCYVIIIFTSSFLTQCFSVLLSCTSVLSVQFQNGLDVFTCWSLHQISQAEQIFKFTSICLNHWIIIGYHFVFIILQFGTHSAHFWTSWSTVLFRSGWPPVLRHQLLGSRKKQP